MSLLNSNSIKLNPIKSYAVITTAYWGFTLTDGALRMLVVLYFHQLGYSAIEVASLFLFYEFFGVVTNLFGGWLATRFGLNKTLFTGLILQVVALYLLSLEGYLSVAYVMFAQAISGIAKDLNKMSAKSSLKLILPQKNNNSQNRLFKWVAYLTGSKNALKGIGFFLGGFLLELFGYQSSLIIMSISLAIIGVICFILLPGDLTPNKTKVKFKQLFSKSSQINHLSFARFFLFGARDIWFVIALPVYLQASLNWQHSYIGGLMAIWIILYGIVQSSTPKVLGFSKAEHAPSSYTATKACLSLLILLVVVLICVQLSISMTWVILIGLLGFAVIFAINSAIHSYLILAFSNQNDVSLDVGFYYMSNAAGRLLGTLLSGLIFQYYGLVGCLTGSGIMILICWLASIKMHNLTEG